MSDELVKRHVEQLRMTGGDLADLCRPLADAIEALTSERDKYEGAWMTAEGKLADAEALIEAQAKDHASNNIRFAEAEHRAEAAETERDRLREALTNILRSHAVSNVRTRPQNLMAETARAALKGETP